MGFEVAFLEKVELELANLLRAQFIRRAMEVFSKLLDGSDVGTCGSLGVIPALEFLEHPFSKLGHRDLLVTHTISSCLLRRGPFPTRSVRRASGLVHTRLPESGLAWSRSARHLSANPTFEELGFVFQSRCAQYGRLLGALLFVAWSASAALEGTVNNERGDRVGNVTVKAFRGGYAITNRSQP